ncbi:MAG: threonylcarbamoyl-AMP synthase [Anaerolineales bacterium]|nr:threonylcarbamoyl-AMP synthase [Anaerolineales bacterium]
MSDQREAEMRVEVIAAEDPGAITRALQVLNRGGLVAFPTDTVYGLGARVFDPEAVQRLYRVKGRHAEKAIPVLLAGLGEASKVALKLPRNARRLAAVFWPGPLTLIVWRRTDLPPEISADATVGLRVPNERTALALLTAAGPLAVTSANPSGQPSARTAGDVKDTLAQRVDLILDGGKTLGGESSTVLDCTRTIPRILRPGPIQEDEIMAALR